MILGLLVRPRRLPNPPGRCPRLHTSLWSPIPMEDFHVAKFVHAKGHELGLFAIYDGHLGDTVPAYLQKQLFSNILKQEEFWTDTNRSISKAYERTNQAILTHTPELGLRGSTAVTAILIDGEKLWIANVRDSRGVLSKRGQAIQVTVDHESSTERGSIENRGGFVSNMPGMEYCREEIHGKMEFMVPTVRSHLERISLICYK